MASVFFMILVVVPYVWLLTASSDSVFRRMHNVRDNNDSGIDCSLEETKCNSDCTTLTTCYKVGPHFYPLVHKCDKGEMCDPYNKECSSKFTSCPRFQCGGEGVFPDLVDCAMFHVCDSAGTDMAGSCTNNTIYDAKVQDCINISENVSSVCQTTPVPQCKNNRDTGVLETNPSIYYTCGNGQAKLYYCPDKTQFNPDTFECADAALACVGVGQTGLNYTDPNNCKMYYACKEEKNFARHLSCPDKQYFDRTTLKCVDGDTCKSK